MADNFRNYIVTFILIGIFFISAIMFYIQFTNDNPVGIDLLSNTRLNRTYSNISDVLSTELTTSKNQLNATLRDELTINVGDLTISSIWGSLTKFTKVIVSISNLMLDLLSSIGVSYIIIGGIIMIIIVTTIFLMWQTIRNGT